MSVLDENLREVADIIEFRRDRFGLLASVFSRESSEESVGRMIAQANAFGPDLDESIEFELNAELRALQIDSLSSFATLTRTEYARLFLGPRTVVAPLHESAYLSGTSRMFTAETLAVRDVYERNGYIMKAKNKEPEDGVGTEFEFLRNLCDRCLDLLDCSAADACDTCELARLLQLQKTFEEQHMRRWMHLFARRVMENDRSGFYAAWAGYLLGVLDEEANLVDVCLNMLPEKSACA